MEAVANTQNDDAVGLRPLWETGRERRGIRSVDGVRSTGEYNDPRVEFCDGGKRGGPGNVEGEDGKGADSASYEVGLL